MSSADIALDNLTPGLMAKIEIEHRNLTTEAAEIIKQWDGLRRAGGQRADHAAALLKRLRPALGRLAKLATAADTAINRMVDNPFGDD
jgi:hypothetical protein